MFYGFSLATLLAFGVLAPKDAGSLAHTFASLQGRGSRPKASSFTKAWACCNFGFLSSAPFLSPWPFWLPFPPSILRGFFLWLVGWLVLGFFVGFVFVFRFSLSLLNFFLGFCVHFIIFLLLSFSFPVLNTLAAS